MSPVTRHPSIGTGLYLAPVPRNSPEHLNPDSP